LLDLCHNMPANRPTIAIPAEVSIVHGPAPNARSLIVMLSHPTTNPGNGPATIPAIMIRNAVGLTLGGPPASPTRKAALAAEKEAMRANSLVLLGNGGMALRQCGIVKKLYEISISTVFEWL
jgi:hypothetical protein